MPFLNLPNEIILGIAQHLDELGLSNLLQAYHHLTLLIPLLETTILDRTRPESYPKSFEPWEVPALSWAAHHGFKDLAEILLDNRADANLRDSRTLTPLMYAVCGGNGQGLWYNYPAICGSNGDMLKLFLNRGADASASAGAHYYTPFHRAAAYGNETQLRIFLENRYKIDDTNVTDGCTALHYAALSAKLTATSLLVQQGADIKLCCNQRRTALHWAARRWVVGDVDMGDQEAVLSFLLRMEASVTAKDKHGNTPLHTAV